MTVKVFDLFLGEIRDLDEADAKELVASGRAEYVNDAGQPVKRPPKKKT